MVTENSLHGLIDAVKESTLEMKSLKLLVRPLYYIVYQCLIVKHFLNLFCLTTLTQVEGMASKHDLEDLEARQDAKREVRPGPCIVYECEALSNLLQPTTLTQAEKAANQRALEELEARQLLKLKREVSPRTSHRS